MNTKLRCLILDDELPGLTYLKMLCDQVPDLEVVKAFNSPDIFLREKDALEFDFCILDIHMPGLDGLSIANLLTGIPIIFTTAFSEYAAEAFDLEAVDYIRKPIRKERFEKAIEKMRDRLRNAAPQKSFVQLNTDKGKTLLYFENLCYIAVSATDSRDKIVLLDDNQTLTLKNISFDQLLELLPSDRFCRVNKREIIALRCVRFFSHDQIETTLPDSNGKFRTLTLGDAFRNNFLRLVEK